jgi:hypothetical protein
MALYPVRQRFYTLKMEAVGFSKMWINFYQTLLCRIQEVIFFMSSDAQN